jgi:protein O-GlcNAc transferase
MNSLIAQRFRNAIACYQAGRLEEAVAECRGILARQADHFDALQMIGLSLAQLGQKQQGADSLENALRYQPKHPALCNNLGELYRQLGRLTDAERLLRQALAVRSPFAEAAMNLGNTLKDQERHAEAIEWFQKTVEWRPDYANAHLNLANTLWGEGRVQRAVQHYLEFLRLHPPRCDVLISLGGAYADLGEMANAKKYYEQASGLDPDHAAVDTALGQASFAQGQIESAAKYYARIAAQRPDCLLKRLRVESLCEIVAPSAIYIDEYRTRLKESLLRLQAERFRFDVDELHSSGAEPPMLLAYQGRDDRELKEQYAALFTRKIPACELPSRSGKPHLGIVVTNGHEGVYAECLGRLVARLANRAEMNVTVICSQAAANIIPHLLGPSAVRYLVLPIGVAKSAARIAEVGFDLLHYWEVGTDSTNYFLPFFQAAPVQSACWGWPVTTGQAHIRYFVSSRWIEPDDGATHYTEQLVPLETLPTWYTRPPVPSMLRGRGEFGLPAQGRIYLCTQNIRKYHPDFDPVLADLLRQDVHGRVCLIGDAQTEVSRQLHARFSVAFPDVAARLLLVPRQNRGDYLNLVALADVVLDTPHYGGGANSIYDAFACGTPVITRPGSFHRGRYCYGVCRKLELPELIATSDEDYVARAIRIASEPDLRQELKFQILERSGELFEDESAVRQHETFFLDAIARHRSKSESRY